MARLPQPGGDAGNWGSILNDYLAQSHKPDGTIKDNAVTASALAPNSVTNAALAADSVSAATIADGSITEALLTGAVQAKLNASASIADGSIAKDKLVNSVQTSLDNADNALTQTVGDSRYATLSSLDTKVSVSEIYSIPPIVAYGDSTTAGGNIANNSQRWATMLAASLATTVENLGSSGATSAEIAARQGGATMTATVAGNTIPASGGVTLTNLNIDPLRGGDINSLLASIDGVQGTITRSGADRIFTRSVSGSPISVASVVDILSIDGILRLGRIHIIGFGTNDIPLIEAGTLTVDEVCANFVRATSILTPARSRVLVWGLSDRGASEGAGTQRGGLIRQIETFLDRTYGANFINVRKHLVTRGLIDAGITPTAQDTSDIAAGSVPQSLRDTSSVHLNTAGQRVQYMLFDKVIRQRGWIADTPPVDITPPTVAITAPASGTVSGAVTVSGTVTDDRGVGSVSIIMDGVTIGSATVSGTSWSFAWDTTGTANSTKSLVANAVDATGNDADSTARSYTISNTAPQIDPIMSSGSIILVDPSHPSTSWSSGVPSADASLPNIASAQAVALIGGSPDVTPKWTVGTLQSSANSIFERSDRGGLHGIVSQTTAGMGTNPAEMGRGAYIAMPQSIMDYLSANSSHSYFSSIWTNVTRVSGETNPGSGPIIDGAGGSDPSVTYLYYRKVNLARPVGGATLGRREAANPDVLGTAIRNVGSVGKTGSAALTIGSIAQWGKVAANVNGTYIRMPSFIFYRFYLEDLTVSGRSYATVDSIDNQQYTTHVTTTGGRYYQDTTPTSPNALA